MLQNWELAQNPGSWPALNETSTHTRKDSPPQSKEMKKVCIAAVNCECLEPLHSGVAYSLEV